MIAFLRRFVLALGWLACAVLLAFGSAGLVAGLSREPGTPARPELTWAADEAVRPGLAAATADLARLADEVTELGRLGRAALATLIERDLDRLASTITAGTSLVATIDADAAGLRARLTTLPGVGPGIEGRLGPELRAEYAAILTALESTAGLRESWATLTAGSAAAARLATLLADHDRYAAAAARAGSRGSYSPALTELASATATLDQAQALRDVLANTADVTVLDQWLGRNRDLDLALARLYRALRASKGTVTAEVRDAAAAERAAQERLPPDTRGLVVIMADIARGGLNQAVITIELARGRLAAAVGSLDASTPGSSTPGPPSPGPPAGPPAQPTP